MRELLNQQVVSFIRNLHFSLLVNVIQFIYIRDKGNIKPTLIPMLAKHIVEYLFITLLYFHIARRQKVLFVCFFVLFGHKNIYIYVMQEVQPHSCQISYFYISYFSEKL